MKPPTGHARPARPAVKKKPVQLNLQRRSKLQPRDDLDEKPKSPFWKWVGLIALFHLLLIGFVAWLYRAAPAPAPEPFISLLPSGDTVRGQAAPQSAPQTSPNPVAAVHHHHHTPTPEPEPAQPQDVPPPPSATVQQPPPVPAPEPVHSKPVIKKEAPAIVQAKPKPKPAKPKVKVDLTLADGPTSPDAPPVAKPVHIHSHKKTVAKASPDETPDTQAESQNDGLSPAEIERKLGDQMQSAGTQNATKTGTSGSAHSQASPFADFYASISNQIKDKWVVPNVPDHVVDPVVKIHVDPDGRVPPDSVTLVHSSGNQAVDDSALATVRSLGYLLQPLPDRCPPDISIVLQPTP